MVDSPRQSAGRLRTLALALLVAATSVFASGATPANAEGPESFHAVLELQTPYVSAIYGQTTEFVIAFRNTGDAGWSLASTDQRASLGTANPLETQEWAAWRTSLWPDASHVARQSTEWVGPGQLGWFRTSFAVPPGLVAGVYRIYLRPVIDGTTWLEDYGVFHQITVPAAAHSTITEAGIRVFGSALAMYGGRGATVIFASPVTMAKQSFDFTVGSDGRFDFLVPFSYLTGGAGSASTLTMVVRFPFLPIGLADVPADQSTPAPTGSPVQIPLGSGGTPAAGGGGGAPAGGGGGGAPPPPPPPVGGGGGVGAPDAPSTPDLIAADDSGASSTDNITKVTTPRFSGTALPGAIVSLFAGATNVGTATASTGTWTITSTTLADGTYSMTASVTDSHGTSAVLGALSVTIDNVVAAPSAPDLLAADDTGTSSSDNLTSVTGPRFSGTAEAGATVTLVDGATVLGTAAADGAGSWTITSAILASGAHSVRAKQTDLAGNASGNSAALGVTIDTAAAAPSIPDLLAADDSGGSNNDNVTSVATSRFSGTAEANASVSLLEGSIVRGTTTASGAGSWTITSAALADGGHSISAKQTDPAGNISAASPALSVVTDGTAPSTVSALAAADGSCGGGGNRCFELTWTAATDATSGVTGYEVRWTDEITTCPTANTTDFPNSATIGSVNAYTVQGGLKDHKHYCAYMVAIDNAGNRSGASAVTGPAMAH